MGEYLTEDVGEDKDVGEDVNGDVMWVEMWMERVIVRWCELTVRLDERDFGQGGVVLLLGDFRSQ